MGYAVPASIGASAAMREGRVLCVTGDGSMHMNLQELETISHNRLPVKMFIFNNGGYASIKTTQRNFFRSRFVGVDARSGVSLPRWKDVARLFRMKWTRVSDPGTIKARLREVLSCKGPAICEIICSADQAIIPTVYSVKKPDGSMASRPLEDMFPFLEREEFLAQMIVPAEND
jgi:acetolactate synthase-1/2/3 large subunit